MSSPVSDRYLKNLPEFFQADNPFLAGFLRAFENALTENDSDETPKIYALESIIDLIPDYFDPARTPAKFLNWFAGWFALTLRTGPDYNHADDIADISLNPKQLIPLGDGQERSSWNRNLIANAMPHSQRRGTLTGIRDFLQLYIDKSGYFVNVNSPSVPEKIAIAPYVKFQINEFLQQFRIGPGIPPGDTTPDSRIIRSRSRVGESTVVNEARPHFFQVIITIDHTNIELIKKIQLDVLRLLREEKPAHTYGVVTFAMTTMSVGSDLKLGFNTVTGGRVNVLL